MKELVIDGATMTSKEAIYKQFNRIFTLPHHFGNNLDALWDVLTDETEPTIIHFKNLQTLRDEMNGYGEKIIRVFQKLDERTNNYTVRFYEKDIK